MRSQGPVGERESKILPQKGQEPGGEQYTSPPQELVRFFAQSRNQWKAKCRAAKGTIKLQKNRIRFLEESRARWKSRAQTLEREVARLSVPARGSLKKKGS